MIIKPVSLKELSDEDIIEIYNAKAEIKDHTTSSDLVVFIGNSARFVKMSLIYIIVIYHYILLTFIWDSYFYYAFSENDHRQVELVPISGRYYTDQWTTPSPEQQEAFNHQVLGPVVEKHKGQFDRIVLVDHTHSGQSVDAFVRVLKQFPDTKQVPRKFINLVSRVQVRDRWIHLPKTVDTLYQVQMSDELLVGLANDKFYRLAFQFQRWKWNKVNLWEEQQKLISEPPQQRMIEKLRASPQC